MTERDAEPLFEIEIEIVDDTATFETDRADPAPGLDDTRGAAMHDSVNVTVGRAGSLVESTRVSTNGPLDDDPIGGVHTIEIDRAPDTCAKLEIGSPDEIENHDPDDSVPC